MRFEENVLSHALTDLFLPEKALQLSVCGLTELPLSSLGLLWHSTSRQSSPITYVIAHTTE